jgi:hypothetical protein
MRLNWERAAKEAESRTWTASDSEHASRDLLNGTSPLHHRRDLRMRPPAAPIGFDATLVQGGGDCVVRRNA